MFTQLNISKELTSWIFKSKDKFFYIIQREDGWAGGNSVKSYLRAQHIARFHCISSDKCFLVLWLNKEANTEDIPLTLMEKIKDEQYTPIIIKCQCGAEKCGTTHSTWCPKYNL